MNPNHLTAYAKALLSEFLEGEGRIIILSGAGISAESGIPTFRGPEGYWRVGSQNYKPQDIGTFAMFQQQPEEVWKWFLFRRTVCQQAKPNAGHHAVVELEQMFGDRFTLITQNVDGLHLRAGNSLDRTYLIHGSLEFVRCGAECTYNLYAFPDGIAPKDRESDLSPEELELLRCPNCGELTRPHVLWFDEYYNEEYFSFVSAHEAMNDCTLFITVGTSGATNLPNQLAMKARHEGIPFFDVNPVENRFSEMALKSVRGVHLQGPSGEVLPELVEWLKAKS